MPKIHYFSSYGKRQEKYDLLNKSTIENTPWQELELTEPYCFFIPKDFGVKEKYDEGFSVSEIFGINSSGITTSRDAFIIDENKEELEKRIQDFIDLTKDELFNKYGLKDTRDFKIENTKKEVLEIDNSKFTKIDYRIFDTKNIYYEVKLIDWNRQKVMSHMLNKNLGIILMRQFVENNGFNHIFVSKNMIDNRTFSSSRGTAYFFPLYLYQQNPLENKTEKTPNFNTETIKKIEEKLGLVLSPDFQKSGLGEASFTPEDLFDYIYAVLHSKTYRENYKEFLKIDFPKIPFDVTQETFFKMVEFGRELRSYHLLENPNLISKNFITTYPITGDNKIEKVRFEINTSSEGQEGKVFINDTQYFDGVPVGVWEFYIGGYQPAQKWLKDRKGRELNYEDIIHYSKMILSLKEIIRIMDEIEGVFKI